MEPWNRSRVSRAVHTHEASGVQGALEEPYLRTWDLIP